MCLEPLLEVIVIGGGVGNECSQCGWLGLVTVFDKSLPRLRFWLIFLAMR